MCGRFAFSTPLAVFVETFDDFDFSEFGVGEEAESYGRPRFNIAPMQEVPVVPNDGSHRVQLFRWGLIPRWAKDPSIGNRMINARSETIAEKPSFRDAFKKRRCLMMTDGFYEWRTNPGTKTKTPIHIRMKSGRPFAFAGLWETWAPKGDDTAQTSGGNAGKLSDFQMAVAAATKDDPLKTCTIITTEPNPLMAKFHHRMPVILPKQHYDLWLSPDPMEAEVLLPLLEPYPADEMVAYPVATTVNSPRNDSPDCVVQVAPAIEQPDLGI